MESFVGVVTEVTSAITGAVISLVDSSSSSPQEMMVRLKQKIRKMNNPLFHIFLNLKSKILRFGELGLHKTYLQSGCFTRIWEDSGDCLTLLRIKWEVNYKLKIITKI